MARKIVRIAKLDITFSTLRFANIWHYYFKGEMVKTKDFRIAIPKKGKWLSTRGLLQVFHRKKALLFLPYYFS